MTEAPATGRARRGGNGRCAEWTREHSIDPIGTAVPSRGFLLVEWPTPWPRDIGEIPELWPVAEAAARLGIRVQAIDGLVEKPAYECALVLYQWGTSDPAWFQGLEGVERRTSAEDLARDALGLLLSGDGTAVTGQDVLVCGHGQRDVCCGSRGGRLSVDLARTPVEGARVWRTSHLGGHRFAPTALLLPDATSWAYLDGQTLRRLIRREGDVADLLPLYRGCAAFGTPALQVLERAAFMECGWNWLATPRRGIDDSGAETARIEALASSLAVCYWEGSPHEIRTVPVPGCIGDPASSGKTQAELGIRDLVRGEQPLDLPSSRPGPGAGQR